MQAEIFSPRTAKTAARSLALLTLLLAAAATMVPAGVKRDAVAQSGEPIDPSADIGGTWWSVANGDRIVDIVRDEAADTVWAVGDGGLVEWSLSAGDYTQYLAPQNGLPSNKVRAIVKDPSGMLWLGTARGLARFDPDTEAVTAFDPVSSPGMPGLSVTALALSLDGGSLWVGFEQVWEPQAPHPDPGAPAGAFVSGGVARFVPSEGVWHDVTNAELEVLPPGDESEPDFLTITSANVTKLAVGSDGALWVGGRPYFEWQRACPDGSCVEGWVLSGGGLAAHFEGNWRRWRSSLDPVTGCYGNSVTALRADVDRRMWVGTAGDGLLMMRGPDQPTTCASGQAYYLERKLSGETVVRKGLRGRFVWSIDIDPTGRVWIGNGDRHNRGRGIVILDHKNTFHDSTASPRAWESDDEWSFLDLGGSGDPSPARTTSLDIGADGINLFGTSDDQSGDGHGLFSFDTAEGSWSSLRTADNGLPSNHITDIALETDTGAIWFATAERGVARWDVATGLWSAWTAFAPAGEVTTIAATTKAGFARVPIALEDEDSFITAFPDDEPWTSIGNDPTRYKIKGFIPRRSGLGPFLEVDPPLVNDATVGDPVQRIVRGPASDRSTRVAIDGAGNVWVGALKKTWQVNASRSCPAYPDCWLDGGVGRYSPDGTWKVFDPSNSEFLDRDIASVTIDTASRTWLALSDLSASGHGLAQYDPESAAWTLHGITLEMSAGNGAADVSVDPLTGSVWTAHFPVEGIARLPDGSPVFVFYGGGVGRWDGTRWESFTKRQTGSTMRAQGDQGTFFRVLADRANGRVWAGGWDARGGPETFHWPSGRGVNAVLNWCPLDACVPSAWAHRAWPEEGQVGAIGVDQSSRVWVGVHRRGLGSIPAAGGVKLNEGDARGRIDVDSTLGALPSNDITAIEMDPDGMWIGTLKSGAALWRSALPPNPSATPPPIESTTPPSATPSATLTPFGPTLTPTPRPTSDEPTPTAVPSATPPQPEGCGATGICSVHLPFAWRQRR